MINKFDWIKTRPWLAASAAAIFFAALYWGLLASDRYVSEAHVVMERTGNGNGQAFDVSLFFGSASGSHDLYQLRDYLLSNDMLVLLDKRLKLRKHYADDRWDWVSRLWNTSSQERFHEYFLRRVSAEIDTETGILMINAQAYSPEMAHAIAGQMVAEGERYMNDVGHKMAQEQVRFIEQQVESVKERATVARQKVLDYQNKHGIASPQAAMDSVSSVISGMERELSSLRTKQRALLSYLNPHSAELVQLGAQIDALEKQLALDKAKLAAPGGNALNALVEMFGRLQLEAEMTKELYRGALSALESARVEATRKLKHVVVLQYPTLPEEALLPRRLYSFTVFAIVTLMIVGIARLIQGVIREHRD
jgi:capsular polysaccharide transport system permease protein